MIDQSSDKALRELGRLPRLAPDPRRAERVRADCRARLARRGKPMARRTLNAGSAALVCGQALLGGLCVIYLTAIVHDALRVRGIL